MPIHTEPDAPPCGPRPIDTMTVQDVMSPGIVSCAETAAAATVAWIMAKSSVHCVAVMGLSKDESRAPRIWGIVSDLDVLEAVTRPGSAVTAADLASEPVITVRPDLPLREAAEAMVRSRAHHVAVVDSGSHIPIGILSTIDVAAALACEVA